MEVVKLGRKGQSEVYPIEVYSGEKVQEFLDADAILAEIKGKVDAALNR